MNTKNEENQLLTAIIVDDEQKSRQILSRLLEEYCPGVRIAALAKDVLSGIKAINDHDPDLVFLDIEMPNYSGFNLIEHYGNPDFEVVFTTAYDQYALKGIKVSAAGYLLKPIDIDELVEVVDRVRKIRNLTKSDPAFSKGNAVGPEQKRIVLPAKNGIIYLDMDEICHLESDQRYTRIFLVDGDELLTTNSLKDCIALLEGHTFLQIHRSVIINLLYLNKYARGRDSFIVMDNGVKLNVGKSYKEELAKVVSLFIK